MRARRVELRQPTPGTTYGDDTQIYYGQRFSGAIFDNVEVVDHPQSIADVNWIRQHLAVRMAPGGTITREGEPWQE